MRRRSRMQRGIYPLPTLFTVGNLFCGFYSVVLASAGQFERSAMLILVAAVLDGLDGRIARLTGGESEFGREFDSMADVVSFGVAPAILSYRWMLQPMERFGWLLAFLYVVCAVARLARFNLQVTMPDKRFFAGLPSPAAGSMVGVLVFAFPDAGLLSWPLAPTAILLIVVASLMLSRMRYRSFKDLDLRDRRTYLWVLPVAALLVAVALSPKYVLLGLCTIYLLSAPVAQLWALITRAPRPAQQTPSSAAVEPSSVVDEPVLR